MPRSCHRGPDPICVDGKVAAPLICEETSKEAEEAEAAAAAAAAEEEEEERATGDMTEVGSRSTPRYRGRHDRRQ